MYKKTAPRGAVKRYSRLLGNSAVFVNRAIDAVDGVVSTGSIPILVFTDGIPFINSTLKLNALKIGALPKYIIVNGGNRVPYCYAHKVRTVGKCRSTNGNYAIRKRYACQIVAIRERPLADGGYAANDTEFTPPIIDCPDKTV